MLGTPQISNVGGELLSRANKAAENLRVEEAVALYTKAIESGNLLPDAVAAAYYGRGNARLTCLEGHGVKDEEMLLALHDFQKALEIRPSTGAYWGEATAYTALGGYNEAL